MKTPTFSIIHINASDHRGGAARAAYRIHRALLKRNCISKMLVAEKLTDDPTVFTPFPRRASRSLSLFYLLLDRILVKKFLPGNIGYFTSGLWGFPNITNNPLVLQADIICLYWVSGGFLSIGQVGWLLNLGKPVFWRFSDLWPLTSGAHYLANLDISSLTAESRGQSKCSRLSRYLLGRKRKWNIKELTVIAPSLWLQKIVKNSYIYNKIPIYHIPTGVDTDLFSPLDRALCKKELGFSQYRSIILAGALKFLNSPRKGYKLFLRALQKLDCSLQRPADFAVAVLGSHDMPLGLIKNIPVVNLGVVNNDAKLVKIYSACDFFVCPSIIDNLPNMALEALSCERPVLAHDVGGLPDCIQHLHTGFLADIDKEDSLCGGINYLLENPDVCKAMGKAGRKQMVEKFNIDKYADMFIQQMCSRSGLKGR